jgi:hypothetical protein
MEEPFGIRLTAALIASQSPGVDRSLASCVSWEARRLPIAKISPKASITTPTTAIARGTLKRQLEKLARLRSEPGVMMCSNAASVSSPDGGRGRFEKCLNTIKMKSFCFNVQDGASSGING